MLRKSQIFLNLAFLVLCLSIALGMIFESQPYQKCHSDYYKKYAAQAANQEPSIISIVWGNAVCGARFINPHNGIVSAVATILLFFVTGGLFWYTAKLWRSTSELVGDAKKSSERQLQAYVYFDGPTVRGWPPDNPNRASVIVDIVNSGATWAKNVQYLSAIVPMEQTDTTDPFDKMDWTKQTKSFVLGPNQRVSMQVGDINRGTMLNVQAGKMRLFIVGMVTYEDAVGSTPGIHQTQMSRKFKVDGEGNFAFSYAKTHNCVDEDCQK